MQHTRTHTHTSISRLLAPRGRRAGPQQQAGGLFHRPYAQLRGEMARLTPKTSLGCRVAAGDIAVKTAVEDQPVKRTP